MLGFKGCHKIDNNALRIFSKFDSLLFDGIFLFLVGIWRIKVYDRVIAKIRIHHFKEAFKCWLVLVRAGCVFL